MILGSLHWEVAFALLGSALVLIAVGARPSLPLLVLAMTAAIGHLAAGSDGTILAAVLMGLIWLVWTLEVAESRHGKKLAKAAASLAKRFETVIEHAVLSPLTAKSLAARGRLPWRLRRFLRYCSDALLVKPSDGEIEFVHRRLRDYFALRELVPQIEAADSTVRTRAIAAFGFQGVSAVDTLSDLAQDGDAAERVRHPKPRRSSNGRWPTRIPTFGRRSSAVCVTSPIRTVETSWTRQRMTTRRQFSTH